MVSGLKTRFSKPFSLLAASLIFAGLLLVLLALSRILGNATSLSGLVGFLLFLAGSGWFIYQRFHGQKPFEKHHFTWFQNLTTRGISAWLLALGLTAFYCLVYWQPDFFAPFVNLADPFSLALRGKVADHWFLYSAFYSLAVLIMGGRALLKYRSSRYHKIRTVVNMGVQLLLAFLLPNLLVLFKQPEFYFSYFWPLKYEYLFPENLNALRSQPGGLPVFMIFWSLALTFLATPVLTYFFGKRWYCSWVCGCGALAETAGDPFRHLSDKSRAAWQIEVAVVYSILGFIIITTGLLWLNSFWKGSVLGSFSAGFASSYGFFIGLLFSGVIGVGFYPLLGSRVWCRFGCPMAAYLGLLQKHFSRFRITTNGGQCISCGNCSAYCEMGIDVKWYAQQGKPIIRAGCVGCGMCATVCPRGVLKLENQDPKNRNAPTPFFRAENLRILD